MGIEQSCKRLFDTAVLICIHVGMHNNNISTEIEELIGQTMAKITEAASKRDLAALEVLTKRATEMKQMKEQISAIEHRLHSMGDDASPLTSSPKPTAGFRREIQIEVTQGMINQNLLTLTDALKRGTIRAGEELNIEAVPSGEKFKTVLMTSGNKLQERGAVGKFYRQTQVSAGDCVVLVETSPGQWKLSKKNGGL